MRAKMNSISGPKRFQTLIGCAVIAFASLCIPQPTIAAPPPADMSYFKFATFLGSSLTDEAHAVAVDSVGRVYIAGSTRGSDFPSPRRVARYGSLGGIDNAFIARLSATGSRLDFIVYFGGSGSDIADCVALDSAGQVYIGGTTDSSDFPTANAMQQTWSGDQDGFLVKLNPKELSLVYSTYIGSPQNDWVTRVRMTTDDHPVLAGRLNGSAFVGTLGSTGMAFDSFHTIATADYATARDLRIGSDGTVFVVGNGVGTGFVARFGPDGDNLMYTTEGEPGGFVIASPTTLKIACWIADYPYNELVVETIPIDNFFYPVTITHYPVGGVAGLAVDAFEIDSAGFASLFWHYSGQEFAGGGVSRIAPNGRFIDWVSLGYGAGGLTASPDGSVWAVSQSINAQSLTLNPLQPTLRGGSDCYVTRVDYPIVPGPAPQIVSVGRKPNSTYKTQIKGTNFHPRATLFVGDSLWQFYGARVKNSTTINVDSDLLSLGPITLTVMNPDGTSATFELQQ